MEISRLRSRKYKSEIVNQIWAKNKYYGFSKGKQHLLHTYTYTVCFLWFLVRRCNKMLSLSRDTRPELSMPDRSPMSNYTPVCLRVCGGEREPECALVCVPPIVFLVWRDLAKRAAHRNWIRVKTREWWVTSLACSGCTSLLWSSLGGIKK